MGAKIEILNERTVNNEKVADIRATSSSLKATEIKGALIPRLLDEIPIIAVAATMAKGTTVFKDLNGFKIKRIQPFKIYSTGTFKNLGHPSGKLRTE